MLAASGTVTTLLIVCAAITASVYGGRSTLREYRRHNELVIDLAQAEPDAETYWTAVRLMASGFRDDALQDEVCHLTNCTPDEASSSILAASRAEADGSFPDQ
ncbi:MAG: hypothetical protein ACI91O_000210 [Candidatus Poriferisodalaceae bacterium]|jgi:hypothetical protein